MGSGAIKSQEENFYECEDVKLKNGVYYLNIPRERYKIPSHILNVFAKRNDFSKDDSTLSNNTNKTKKEESVIIKTQNYKGVIK